jgi:5-methylcytosine-specific restriction endonuclease McrA
MASRQLRPHLNQIREWVRQGRTDAWIAHQLEVSSEEIAAFKREQALAGDNGAAPDADSVAPSPLEELDLRAEDDAAIAAELEAVLEEREANSAEAEEAGSRTSRSRRRGRRGGRRRRRPAYEATFDHGEEGYGLWLDPAVVEDGVYAEHWAGHRPIAVTITPEQIVITKAGAESETADEPEAD